MKENIKKWLKPILFTAGGALVGLAYYYFVGCSTGACPLTLLSRWPIWALSVGCCQVCSERGAAVHAICSSLPGGNHHLHIALTASYAAHLYLLFCRRWATHHKKTLLGALGFVSGFTVIFVAMGAETLQRGIDMIISDRR